MSLNGTLIRVMNENGEKRAALTPWAASGVDFSLFCHRVHTRLGRPYSRRDLLQSLKQTHWYWNPLPDLNGFV